MLKANYKKGIKPPVTNLKQTKHIAIIETKTKEVHFCYGVGDMCQRSLNAFRNLLAIGVNAEFYNIQVI